MKTKFLLILLTAVFTSFCYAQEKVYITYEEGKDAKELIEEEGGELGLEDEKVSLGLSLGFNYSLKELQSASLSPIDNSVLLEDEQKGSFVLSTVVSVPLFFNTKRVFRFKNSAGELEGTINRISALSAIAVVNLVTFSGAASGSTFNQQISGGLGISYNFNENFAIGLTYEVSAFRQPKDFLIESEGETILIGEMPLTSLNVDDNRFFKTQYNGLIAFKFIYKLTTK